VHYFRPVPAIPPVRTARPEELALLPALEWASDTLFLSLEIGPLPPPGPVEALRAALVVLVAGDPPVGFVRVDDVGGEAHLEQLAVHPDHGRQGIGRALVQAACCWAAAAGYGEITLATYRDVPWNGPFYASAGFVERGSVEAWCAAHGRPPEQPVLARFGTRVLMRRPL
jgi:GNAT superfamily N-acetyltransferase